MKRIKLAILFLLIPLCCIAFAALTKTTAIDELDPWQSLAAATMINGNHGDIHLSYETLLYLVMAYTDTDAQDGVEVSIEVSYGDDDWTLLTKFTTAGSSSETNDLEGGESAGATTVDLEDASDFLAPGLKWFIVDGINVEHSETVRTKSEAGDIVTLCHDLLRDHADNTVIWNAVVEHTFSIPAAFAYVRVLINNTDADAGIHFTTRLSKVTAL